MQWSQPGFRVSFRKEDEQGSQTAATAVDPHALNFDLETVVLD